MMKSANGSLAEVRRIAFALTIAQCVEHAMAQFERKKTCGLHRRFFYPFTARHAPLARPIDQNT
jgi:hypothetical protein